MRTPPNARAVLGVVLIAAGVVVLLLGKVRLPLGRLPSDISYRGKSFSFYFPVASSLVISILLTLFFYLLSRFRR